MTEQASTTPRAGRREWWGLAVIALACVLYVMDLTVLHLAVPAISADLQPSSTQMLWIIDIYGFMIAGSLITMGSLGDRIGRRRLLLIGAAAFGVTSVLAAFSTSPEMLIVTRALLGVSGATLAPSTLSLIRSMFHDPRQRTTAIGIWITSFSAGAAIGPVLGGVVLEYFWWGAVFLLNVPVMVALLVLGPRLLPEYRDPDAGRADLPSAALSLSAMLGLVYGLKRAAQDGMTTAAVVTALAGVALAIVFIRRQRRLVDPLIDLSLFRIPAFSAALATYGIGIFVIFGGFLFIPQYLQLVLGMTPLEAGLWTLPWALSFVVGSNVTPVLARRIDPTWLMGGGLVLAALGFGLLLGIEPGSGLPLIVLGSVAFSLGMSPVFTLTNDLIMASAPPERAGAAAGVSETAAEVGGALGIAVLGSIGVAVYRRDVDDALPGSLSSEQGEAARGTLGGAVEVAEGLPSAAGEALVAAAEAAFTTGVHLGALIAAVASLALAAFVLTRGRAGLLNEEPQPVDELVACGDDGRS
ncbi:MFS transporter [Nocardioides antri]|uniref:MFS transporter n=1 Tax=Nocardioides antri TaxID=2607659 RepID=A0A5B1M3X5_9ACTN|nr:MFS transporter [Nocardioides antri]KAA1427622.1 MFS transporter [Nocardioides antri]